MKILKFSNLQKIFGKCIKVYFLCLSNSCYFSTHFDARWGMGKLLVSEILAENMSKIGYINLDSGLFFLFCTHYLFRIFKFTFHTNKIESLILFKGLQTIWHFVEFLEENLHFISGFYVNVSFYYVLAHLTAIRYSSRLYLNIR